jgi:hypothetical protein
MLAANDLERLKNIVRHWLPLAVLAVTLCGLAYLSSQQALRQGANDPQIALAEDAAAALAGGESPSALVPTAQVDVARSLSPFLIVYAEGGQVQASSGRLRGRVPVLPEGVLAYTRQHGQDRVTWQPEPGVRIAAVVVHAPGGPGGFVLAGRSLREVEKREDQALWQAAGILVAALAATLAVVLLAELFLPRRG